MKQDDPKSRTASVPGETQTKQAVETPDPWWWVKPGVWTDRMLKRLEKQEPTTVMVCGAGVV